MMNDIERFAASRDPDDAMSEADECIREWREQNDPDYEEDQMLGWEDEGGAVMPVDAGEAITYYKNRIGNVTLPSTLDVALREQDGTLVAMATYTRQQENEDVAVESVCVIVDGIPMLSIPRIRAPKDAKRGDTFKHRLTYIEGEE